MNTLVIDLWIVGVNQMYMQANLWYVHRNVAKSLMHLRSNLNNARIKINQRGKYRLLEKV